MIIIEGTREVAVIIVEGTCKESKRLIELALPHLWPRGVEALGSPVTFGID